MGDDAASSLTKVVGYCCQCILLIPYWVVMIIALVDSAEDTYALDQSNGKTYYSTLPIVSIVLPNPITTGIIAYSPDCNTYNNCDKRYRSLYIAGFWLQMVQIIACCGLCCLLCG